MANKKGNKAKAKKICQRCKAEFEPANLREKICPTCREAKANTTATTSRKKKKKDKRTCLRCDRKFPSEGIYNRICPNCRESNSNSGLAEPAQSSDYTYRSGRRGPAD